jgi:hypothetical protein
MSWPIYPALVGEGARLGRSKTGGNQQRDDQRREAGSSHEGNLPVNVTWDDERDSKAPGSAAAVHQCGTRQSSAGINGIELTHVAEKLEAIEHSHPLTLLNQCSKNETPKLASGDKAPQ